MIGRRPWDAAEDEKAGFSHTVRVRLHDTSGVILAEQLVSILFIGLLCVAVAAGIGAAMTSYVHITQQTDAQQILMRAIDEIDGELVYARDVAGESFVSPTTHTEVVLTADERGIVLVAADGDASTVLVGGSDGLVPGFEEGPTYDVTTNSWSYRVVIDDLRGDEVMAQDMMVKRMEPAVRVGS